MRLRNANTVDSFKVIIVGRQRAQRKCSEDSMCSLGEEPALQFILSLKYVVKLCTCKPRQLSWSTPHLCEQAALTESLFFFCAHGYWLHCLINELKFHISPFIEVLTQGSAARMNGTE